MIIFGVAKEDRHRSIRDRLLSKKYMGECRCEVDRMVSKIRQLPNVVIK
jgi:hypothetical protein